MSYDAEMIRDFLDNLAIEVRMNHFENASEPTGLVSEEMVEELKPYLAKYNTALLVSDVVGQGEVSEEERQRAIQILRSRTASTREQQLRHLEALKPLFAEALVCIEAGEGVFPVRQVEPEDILSEEERPED